MKRLALLPAVALALLAIASPASAVRVNDPTPTGAFSDSGNAGYVEVDENGALRVCNENPNTPAGDSGTGYGWVNPNGEGTRPTYGNSTIGAGDSDGSDDGDPANGNEANDCP
ncbi:MAG TPA: hypothetical protein VNE62_07390 [Actinomycetota bacterium]|nr:hypothetical protein [Actinomycetota bacterium]